MIFLVIFHSITILFYDFCIYIIYRKCNTQFKQVRRLQILYKMSVFLTKLICSKNDNDISAEDCEKINYSIEVILSEGSKISILLLIFISLGGLRTFIFSFIILLSIRTFAGGFHAKNSFQCLLFSITFFIITSVWVFSFSEIPNGAIYIILSISLILNLLYAPNPSINRPIISKTRNLRLKIASVVATGFWSYMFLFYIKDVTQIKCGVVTILLQSVQLIKFKGDEIL